MKPSLLLLTMLLSGAAVASSHTTVYPMTDMTLANVGTIHVGAPLTELSQNGQQLNVELAGVQPAGNNQVIFLGAKQRIVLATLNADGVKALKTGKTFTDAYGNQWHSVTLTAQIPNQVTAQQQQLWTEAAQLKDRSCSVCHAAPVPTQMSVNAWPSVVKSMGGRTDLTQAQLQLLTSYYQYNAIHK